MINLSKVFAGQNVGIKEISDRIWLVTFMQYDLGFFDHETCRLESAENPLAYVTGIDQVEVVARGGIEPPTRGFSDPAEDDPSESTSVNPAK